MRIVRKFALHYTVDIGHAHFSPAFIYASMVLYLDASDVCVMPDSHCVLCSFGSQTLNCALKSRAKCQSAQRGKEHEMVAGSGRGKGVVAEEKTPWVELVQ